METERHIPTIQELIELPEPADVQIAPDGAEVAFVVREPDWKENKYVWQIWLASSDCQSPPRQLTFAKQGSTLPRWSQDGRWLAFLSRRDGGKHTQIYRLSSLGGEAERLTDLESAVRSLAWSPDGKQIAYTTVEVDSEADEKRKEMYGEYHVEDEDYKRTQLWVLELEGKRCRKLTGGDAMHVGAFDWAPDGSQLAFQALPTPDAKDWTEGRICTVDLQTLEVVSLTGTGYDSPCWSPDGRSIACLQIGDPWYKNSRLCLIDVESGEVEQLECAFDEQITLLDYGPGGLYFGAVQGTAAHVFRLDLADDKVRQLTPDRPDGWVSLGASFTAGFDQAALIASDEAHYGEVVVLDLTDRAVRHLTDFQSRVSEWDLGQQEVFGWTNRDGTSIEGVLTKPPDFDPGHRSPLLVVIHGGPAWASFRALLAGSSRRLYPIPLWAAKRSAQGTSRGALILEPNYRGSTGYGESFRSLNVRNLGLGDYEDVISGVDVLIEKGWVDPERVGAMGWSQGGYISAFITTYSDRFRAVSVGAGISNWVTYYVNTDIHPFTRHYLEAVPWDEPAIYEKTSPMTYIQQAQTPTLIQHGRSDRRVPLPNAYELYQGLQDVGVPVRLVTYPGMSHGPTKPRQSRQIMQDNLEWFNRWIWGEEPEPRETKPCYVVLASSEQGQDEGEIAALQRYTATAIQDVYHWARRDRADYRILSGRFGLLPPDGAVGPDEQYAVAAEAVSSLAARLAEQLREQGWKRLVLYTAPLEKQPSLLIALGCVQVAAGIVGGVAVEHCEISDERWIEIVPRSSNSGV
jgi:dipeptidyl aminopeptidase/acylaminoacyl peptidase